MPPADDMGLEGLPEEYATGLEADAVQAEALKRRSVLKKHQNGVKVATLLVLGLRRIRAEYAASIGSWRQLWACESRASVSSVLEAAMPPFRSGEGPRGTSGIPSSRERGNLFQERLDHWASSQSGMDVVIQLRWTVPSHNQLVARMRRELWPLQWLGQVQLRRACVPLGIPVLDSDGTVTWGSGLPGWQEARVARRRLCLCADVVPPDRVAVCEVCDGVRLAPPTGLEGTCRWCGLIAAAVCETCRRGIHFLGQCHTGGASHWFSAGGEEWVLQCPDCAWEWVRTLHHGPRRASRTVAVAAVDQCMRELARQCQRGAGSDRLPRGARVQRLRRWVLERLVTLRWASCQRLLASARAGGGPLENTSGAPTIFMAVVARLCDDGRVWRRGAGHDASVRLRASGEVAPPHWARHRRRSRVAEAVSREPPRTRRRT